MGISTVTVFVIAVTVHQVIAVTVHQVIAASNEKKIGRAKLSFTNSAMTPEERKIKIYDLMLEYIEDWDGIKKDFDETTQQSMSVMKDLFVYYLMPLQGLGDDLKARVQQILPVSFIEDLSREQNELYVERELSYPILNLEEVGVIEALIKYQCAAPGGVSVHSEVKDKFETIVSSKYTSADQEKSLTETELQKMRKKYLSDPLLLIHELNPLICLQSFHHVFYPRHEGIQFPRKAGIEWSSEKVVVNGKYVQITGINKNLETKIWEDYSKLEDTYYEMMFNVSVELCGLNAGKKKQRAYKVYTNYIGGVMASLDATDEDRKRGMKEMMLEYLEDFDSIKMRFGKATRKDLNLIKDLMVYYWVHFLNPDQNLVKKFLPNLQNEGGAQTVEEKLKSYLEEIGEKKLIDAWLRYIYSDDGKASVNDNVKKVLETYLQSLYFEEKKSLTTYSLGNIIEDDLIRYLSDPILQVQSYSSLMCKQSLNVIFHPDDDSATWPPDNYKGVVINGKTVNIRLDKSFMRKDIWVKP